ncbi:MAG: YdcF family protein [Sphingomicrobium sp.]
MIARAAALLLLIYAIGFMLFAFTLGEPAPAGLDRADSAVVLTGGPERIEHSIEVLRGGRVKRVLIAGADPVVTKKDIARRLGGDDRLIKCCVDLGSESVDTRSNAEEAGRWLAKNGFKSVLLITSDWHMRRAYYEFDKVLGGKYQLSTDAVRSAPGFLILFGEYNKYVLRRLAVWADI